jgi:hypothetical protein
MFRRARRIRLDTKRMSWQGQTLRKSHLHVWDECPNFMDMVMNAICGPDLATGIICSVYLLAGAIGGV